MLYTIGRKDLYDRYFAGASAKGGDNIVLKWGRGHVLENGTKHLGGMVFRTRAAAEEIMARIIPDGHDRYIMSVEADWDRDSYQIEGEPFRRLTRDARVHRLSE